MTISVYADPSGNYATMSIGGSEKFRLNSDGTATLGGVPVDRFLTLGSKATTSGTSVEFSPADGTGIPSWAKEITIDLHAVSTSGSSIPIVQLGTAASWITSGYAGAGGGCIHNAAPAVTNLGAGFGFGGDGSAAYTRFGKIIISLISGTIWMCSGSGGHSESPILWWVGGSVDTGTLITRLRITTVGGSNTFDNGAITVRVRG